MSTLTEKERQELSLLLPWYANGTLDGEDSRRVEAALAEDEELAREFDLVLEDQAAMTRTLFPVHMTGIVARLVVAQGIKIVSPTGLSTGLFAGAAGLRGTR